MAAGTYSTILAAARQRRAGCRADACEQQGRLGPPHTREGLLWRDAAGCP